MTTDHEKCLRISTLNFSGILNSPFEFYSVQFEKDQKKLSEIFEGLVKQKYQDYKRQNFKWNLGKIDQKMQKERYTPLYQKNCGIISRKINNNQVEKQIIKSEDQFKQYWQKQFLQQSKNIQFQWKPQEKQRCKQFDFLCYKAILLHSFDLTDINKIIPFLLSPYQRFMKRFYKKSFLNQKAKIQKTLTSIQKNQTDVIFIQQATNGLIQKFDQNIFTVIKKPKSDSIIVLRNKSFTKIDIQRSDLSSCSQQLKNAINWNNDTIFVLADNFTLLCGHLSSKKEKNPTEVDSMLKGIQKIHIMYPQNQLIAGCDVNSYLKNQIVEKFTGLNRFPTENSAFTTLKTRTMLQPQLNKAEVEAKQCRDYIFSYSPLKNSRIVSIEDIPAQKIGYLPCEKHPYDHFMVAGEIVCQK